MNNLIYKVREHKKPALIISIILGVFLLLIIGNIDYNLNKTTGKVTEELTVSSAEVQIAEQIADKEIKSNIDMRNVVEVSTNINSRLMEFDVPEGEITLEFDLLNYADWVENNVQNEVSSENFNMKVNESSEKYKWGYNVKLNNLSFMARIDVKADNIKIIDNQTLKIGNNYISFSDLTRQGYSVRVENPVVLEEINLTTNLTEINGSGNYITRPGSSSEVGSQELNVSIPQPAPQTPQPTPSPTPPIPSPPVTGSNSYITGNVIKSRINFLTLVLVKINLFVKEGLIGTKGFVVHGFGGLTGLVVGEENIVSVYVQRDFTNSSYSVGDIINLDPYLIIIISKAQHLDENRKFISDIYPQVQTKDNNWSETINNNEYVRVTFEQNLTKENDITIYARSAGNDSAEISVYREDSEEEIARFTDINEENWYKVYLNNLSEDESYDVFDLKVLGSVEFDYIVDPFVDNASIQQILYDCGTLTTTNAVYTLNQSLSTTGTCLTVQANNITINLNGFNITGDSNSETDYGINITGYNSTTIKNGGVYNFGAGIYSTGNTGNFTNLTVNSRYNLVVGGYSGCSVYGIYLLGSNNTFDKISSFNYITGCYACSAYAILLEGASNNQFNSITTLYDSMGCTQNNGFGILLGSSSLSNTIKDSNSNTIKDSNFSASFAAVYLGASSTNNTFLNTSYARGIEYVVTGGSLTRKWYYRAYVNDSSGNNVSGANVTAYNVSNSYQFNLTTGADGYTSTAEIIDYVNTGGTKSYYSNYTIYAINSSYPTKSVTYDVTSYHNNLAHNIQIPTLGITNCTILDTGNAVYTLQNSISATSTCFNILANNITINLNGFNITGDNNSVSDYGINIAGYNSITIKNGGIYNFGVGIYSTGNTGNFTNLTVNSRYNGGGPWDISNTCDTYGISLSGSNNTLNNINSSSYSGNCFYCNVNSVSLNGGNNNIINNVILSNNFGCSNYNGYGVFISSSSSNILTDLIIANSNNYLDVYLGGSSTNNSFVNTSYTLSKESVGSGSSLIRKWYYRAHTSDLSGTDVANASVDIFNGIDDVVPYIELTTNSTGWTNTTNIIDYVNTGGTRTYYSNTVIAANYNNTLTDEHSYNVTAEKNNLNDSFILWIDNTPPTLSGTTITMTSDSSLNNVFAVISWVTDTPNNYSNISYGTMLSLVDGSNETYIKNNIPSLTIGPLMNNTLYNFNYTSCDFAGNCNTSSGIFTTISPASIGTTSTGGGTYCIQSWECGVCGGAPVGKTGTQTCTDLNKCAGAGIITKTQSCIVQESYFKPEGKKEDKGIQTELPSASSGRGAIGCVSNWQCSNWSECHVIYNLQDIISEKVLLEGEQERRCIDKNNCEFDKPERKDCDTQIPIYAKKVEKCFKDYLEVFDVNDILISRLEFDREDKILNVTMVFDDNGYCCLDGEKNYDEDEIDCQYSGLGVNCPKCSEELSSLKQNYSFMLITLIGLTLLSLLFIIWYLMLLRKTKKRIRKVVKISHLRISLGGTMPKRSLRRAFKIGGLICLIVLGLAGIYIIGFFAFKLLSNFYVYLHENFDSLASLFNTHNLILLVLVLLSLMIPIQIIKIITIVNRRKLRKLFREEAEILRKGIIKEEEFFRNEFFEGEKAVIKEFERGAEALGKISIKTENKVAKIYRSLIKKYKKEYKRLVRLRKKIFKRRAKLIKKENKRGMPLENQRKKLKQDAERYKISIKKLNILKQRIKSLEDLGYSNQETEKLKHDLDKDIHNLRNKNEKYL